VVPVIRDDIARRETNDDLEGVLQAVEALTNRRELDPELAVLGLEPRGAQSELQASLASVVNGDGRRGQDRGVPVGHTGDEQPETYPARRSGQCGEGGHTFEALTRIFAVHRDVVIKSPRAVEAQLFPESDAIDDLVEGHPLLGDIDPETHTAEASRPDGHRVGGVAIDRERAPGPARAQADHRFWEPPRSRTPSRYHRL
jgi:hypothetical protein